jgi:hypothetical protein
MSFAGLVASAKTSIARVPAPTAYGPCRVAQPPSAVGSSPENEVGPAAAASVALSTRFCRSRTAPVRASITVA